LKSGSLELLESSGTVQACNEIALPLLRLLGDLTVGRIRFSVFSSVIYKIFEV
jgi:hypothetical protein